MHHSPIKDLGHVGSMSSKTPSEEYSCEREQRAANWQIETLQESLYFYYYKSVQLEDEVAINEYYLQNQEAVQEALVE